LRRNRLPVAGEKATVKILYVNPSAQLGGAELCLLDMMAEVRRVRPEWELALLAPSPGPLLERAAALGAEARVLAYPAAVARLGDSGAGGRAGAALRLLAAAPALAGYRRRLKKLIAELQPDVIHANGLKADLLCGSAGGGEPIPVIWHLHDYLGTRPMAARLARRVARQGGCTLAIANSRSVAEDARVILGAVPVRTMYNALDLSEFSPEGECAKLDAMCGMERAPASTLRIGLICTMAWWKGQQDFMRAMAALVKSGAGRAVRGYVIGGPIYETRSRQFSLDELRSLARALGIADRIGFTGFTAQPAAAMRALDIVVHASTEPEPFGRVIVEAQACGKPVVSSSLGGASELITDGETALAYPAGDAAALASRLTELIANADLRRRLAQNGLSSARARVDRRRLGPELAEIYETVTGAPAPRAALLSEAARGNA
jgi:glycosyltransferase involved in cell wall biosynthesis